MYIYIYSRTRSDLEFDGNLGFDTRNEDAKVWLKSCTRRWSSGGHALNPKRLKPETEVADAVVPKQECLSVAMSTPGTPMMPTGAFSRKYKPPTSDNEPPTSDNAEAPEATAARVAAVPIVYVTQVAPRPAVPPLFPLPVGRLARVPVVSGRPVIRVTILPVALRQQYDEHVRGKASASAPLPVGRLRSRSLVSLPRNAPLITCWTSGS